MNGAWLFWLTRRRLSPGQVWLFFGFALLLYSLPLLLNNYAYIDDNIRGLNAATWWRLEGRAFGDWLLHGLSMTVAAPEVFPLTLLAGMLAIAWAMYTLARHWFGHPTPMQCAVLLPLWYNPFYLQVLSYHFDSFAVSVGVALMAQAVVWRHKSHALHWGVPCVLIAAGLSTNQLTLNVFLGLACVDMLVRALRQPVALRLRARAVRHLFSAVAGCIGYALTGYQTMTHDRGGLVFDSLAQWELRAELIAGRLGSFLNPVAAVAFSLVALGALLGLAVILRRVWKRPGRWLLMALCIAAVLGAFLSIGGLLFFIRDPYHTIQARTLMGASPWLIGMLWLAYVGWIRVYPAMLLLLVPPLWCCLAFAYAYGQVMHNKQSLEQFTRTLLLGDLLTLPPVQAAREIAIESEGNGPLFTPNCVMQAWPAMDYIFNNRYTLLPEQLAFWGVNNARHASEREAPTLDEPLLVRPWYRVYVQHSIAYVRFTVSAKPARCAFND